MAARDPLKIDSHYLQECHNLIKYLAPFCEFKKLQKSIQKSQVLVAVPNIRASSSFYCTNLYMLSKRNLDTFFWTEAEINQSVIWVFPEVLEVLAAFEECEERDSSHKIIRYEEIINTSYSFQVSNLSYKIAYLGHSEMLVTIRFSSSKDEIKELEWPMGTGSSFSLFRCSCFGRLSHPVKPVDCHWDII